MSSVCVNFMNFTENKAEKSFNKRQRIILAASDFDEQTLSAVAWLNSNNVDINCYKLTPYIIKEEPYLYIERILPPIGYSDYYIDLLDVAPAGGKGESKVTRRKLPRINEMLEWGVVKAGDIIVAKDREEEAELLANGNVLVDGVEKSMQAWLKDVYGWATVFIPMFLQFIKKVENCCRKLGKNIWRR